MIEIKITIDDAFQLLIERMKYELRMRQKVGFITPELSLEQLSHVELKSIVDVAIFDTLMLLPCELVIGESNLAQIVTTTVRLLPKLLHREDYLSFDEKKVANLIQRIRSIIKTSTQKNIYMHN